MDKRRGIKFFRRNFLAHVAKKIHRETLMCSEKVLVGKSVVHRRGEEASQFSFGFFLSHSTEKIRRVDYFVSEKLWCGKKIWIRRGFHRNFIDSQCP